MAKKVILRDQNNIEILPITRGELILDSSGKKAFHSNEFLATNSQPGLMSKEDKIKIDNMIATKVANKFTLKINSGTTEGTNLYSYNGASAKTLDIKPGTGIGFTTAAGVLTIANSGVRSIATGDNNGTIKVNTNGTSTNVAIKGLGSAAYTASTSYAVSKELATNADLNTITSPGFYNAGGGNSITNKPTGVEHFGLEVIHCASGTYYVQILFEESYSNLVWRRHCINGTWSSWTKDVYTDTHYTTHLYVGSKSSNNNNNSNTSTTNGNTYLKLFDDSTLRHQYNIKGTGNTTVTSDASGNITVNSPTTLTWENITGKPSTFTPATHTHDDRYYTETEVDNLLQKYLPLAGGTMGVNATIKLNTYGTRFLTLSGNSITADMSNETGGWAGNFAAVKHKDANTESGVNTTTMLGWHGSASGLTHIFMGGSYSNPAMKMTPNGVFTFSSPIVGSITGEAGSVAWNNVKNKPTTFTPSDHTHATNKITALTGYTKATAVAALAATDSLNTALGKLEHKADLGKTAYDWYKSVTGTDNDNIINKWDEIVSFIDSVKETETDILDTFVARKTSQVITGQKNFNTNTNGAPLIISRTGGTTEAVKIGVNDSQAIFEYTNDEESNAYVFKLINTDTESSDGSGANTSSVTFTGSSAGAVVQATTFQGKLAYTYLTGSTTTKDQAIVSSGTANGWTLKTLGARAFDSTNYLPLAGGTMTSTAYIAWNSGASGNDLADWSITGNGLRIISSTTTTSKAPTQYSTALHVKGRYGFQIASQGGDTANAFYIRNVHNATWNTLLHSNNYTTYISTTNFPGLNKTGTVTSVTVTGSNGLSGTGTVTTSGTITLSNAGVRSATINGDYLKVNTNGTDKNLTIPYATAAGHVRGVACRGGTSASNSQLWNSTTIDALKLKIWDVYTDDGPTSYGNILEINGINGHWKPQIWFDSGTGQMRVRNRNYNSEVWGAWRLVLDNVNSSVTGGGSTWGSSISVNIGGTTKTLTIPSNPNTDTAVTQSETTTANYRPITLGYTNASTAGSGMTGSVTKQVYVSNKFYAQPSTGSLFATTFVGALKGNADTATNSTQLGGKAASAYLLKSDVLADNLTTIKKTLTVTQDWMDTGITNTNLTNTGTYVVQVYVHNSTESLWYCYWSGVMSWYASGTNDTDSDEILLHRSGHAYEKTIYLRTLMQSNGVLKLQIAASSTLTTAAEYTFKFKRII